jgi:hypothetical protein
MWTAIKHNLLCVCTSLFLLERPVINIGLHPLLKMEQKGNWFLIIPIIVIRL